MLVSVFAARVDLILFKKGSGFMLRKDTIFILEADWEPKVPSVVVMQQQVQKRQLRLAGSVRAARGKLADCVNSFPSNRKNSTHKALSRLFPCD